MGAPVGQKEYQLFAATQRSATRFVLASDGLKRGVAEIWLPDYHGALGPATDA